jgi:hypothetical protein
VSLYRKHDGNWSALSTEQTGSNATHETFRATSPGLSVFAVGGQVSEDEADEPANETTGNETSAPEQNSSFAVTNVTTNTARIVPNSTVSVNATVTNSGTGGGNYTAALALNGSVVATRYRDQSGETEHVRWPAESGGPVTDLSGRGSLEQLLRAVDLTVVERTAAGGVVLAGPAFREGDRLVTPLFVEEPRNVSVRLVVRKDGTVTDQRVAYDATLGSRSVRVVREFRVTAIGETTVDRPPWVENATEPVER